MQAYERQELLDHLTSSQARLLGLVADLTTEQWRFREAPGRWSIAGNLEHLIAFENFIFEKVAKALEGPAEPEKKGAGRGEKFRSAGTCEQPGRSPQCAENRSAPGQPDRSQ